MRFTVCLFVAFLTADAAQLFGKDDLPKADSLLARPKATEDLKNLLHKALESEGTYQRDLLVAAGIVPAPSGYESLKDAGTDESKEKILSSEMQEHFNKHIREILKSLDKLEYALNRLYGEGLSTSFVDIKESELAEHSKSEEKVKGADLSNVPEENKSEKFFSNTDCKGPMDSQSENCKDILAGVPKLPSLPEIDFAMSESEMESGDEFVTSTVVDTITREYVKLFSEKPESILQESSTAGQIEVTTLTPLDEDFIMHVMSSSIPPTSNDIEESTDSEKEIEPITESTKDASDSSDSKTSESDSVRLIPIYGRVLTFEEVKLLDQSLSLKPELKYHVISTSQSNQDTMSNIQFFMNEEDSNSTPMSKKRRRVNPRDISLDEPIFYQAPTPQKMILRYYRDIPDTSFTCENKSQPGFYADTETDCQVFHVCWPGRRESFLCPVGSLFNQKVLSCDNFNKTNCSLSHAYFDINKAFQEFDDAKAHNVTPSPDPMMRPIQNDSGMTEVVAKKSDIVELFEADLHFSEMINQTSITELWDYLPVKAKVFVYPEPADLKKFLEEHHHHKIRKSKDVRGLESSTEMEGGNDEILDDVLEKRQKIEANIIRVLKKLSRKHRD